MFCGLVHICALNKHIVVARLRKAASRSCADSSTTVLQPAVSVKANAGWAFCSTHWPKRTLPVKSTMAVLGCLISTLPMGSLVVSMARVTKLGSKPAACSTWRKAFTVMAMGNTVAGWGLRITGLPVARLAIIEGQAFQVGKLAHEKHTAVPRGTSR